MGWDNPPISWREFERRLSWRQGDEREGDEREGDEPAGADAEQVLGAGRIDDEADGGSGEPDGGSGEAEPVVPWAELHCHSWYSFLDGASEPEKLIAEATSLGLSAIAITDHDGMYGVPQFAQAATRLRNAAIGADANTGANTNANAGANANAGSGVPVATVFGAELGLTRGIGRTGMPDPAGNHLVVLARDPAGYRRLCQVISAAQL
ncbi:MAG TPA: PHP domain-containing protein, partial [Streptosporangiaceae bacterium]